MEKVNSKTDVVDGPKDEKITMKKEEEKMEVQIEPKTGMSFPMKLDDGKELITVGLRKKSFIGLGFKIYSFGIYGDKEKLKELLKSKFDGKNGAAKPTKEMYEVVRDSDVEMMVRLVLVFGGVSMSLVRKGFDEGIGASIKKLNGGQKNTELTNMFMGEALNNIKLTSGSVIEISRLPGHILQTKIKDEIVSKVESELLCRAYINMYLGDDPLDDEAKERFGESLLSDTRPSENKIV